MFRTQLANIISAPGQTPAPTFWAADASSTIPVPPQAYVGSLQPSGDNSWRRAFLCLNKESKVNHGQENNKKYIHGRDGCGCSRHRQRFCCATA
jgi:hypothetical protein